MKHRLVMVGLILLSAVLLARGDGPDDRYVQIYNLIQEADALNDSNQGRAAALKYSEAEKALKGLQADYPEWNGSVVKFRLGYIASKLEPLTPQVPATNAPPPAKAGDRALEAEPSTMVSGSNQVQELQEEIKRLTSDNAKLEARLKEALSVQPAALDPRELTKAEEQIKLLQKDNELLKVSLEQEKSKSAHPNSADPALLDQERQILVDVKQKLAQQTELALALQKENEDLKRQLADPKPATENSTRELAQQLQAAKDTIAALQSSNLNFRAEQILLDREVADLSRQLSQRSKGNHSTARAEERSQQLEVALARLAVYEAKPVPYTAEELAVFNQPDLKANIAEVAPMKRAVKELPPGAGPIMQEAIRATETGRLDEAEKKFLEVLRQDDKNVYVLGQVAMVQFDQGRLEDAEKTVAQALAIAPRDPASLFTMGVIKFRQEKYDAALDALGLAASLIPDEPRTQYFLGKTLIKKGNRVAAEAALRKAVQLRPGWGEAHFSLAMVYATQQPPFKELAQWHYKQAIAGGYARDLEFEKLLEAKKAVKNDQ